jgi:hypothetical protein
MTCHIRNGRVYYRGNRGELWLGHMFLLEWYSVWGFTGAFHMDVKEAFKSVNWEKFGVYLAVASAFVIIVIYIADMKERTRALEVKVEHLEKNG